MNGSLDVLHALLDGLTTGGIFFYKALWSILFGVAVTAAIDVFVDKEKMARLLGGRDVKTVGVATATGAASSACTFGAVTIAQALYKKGASAESTFAFALAATNIVFELSVLIYVLLGGAVLAAEFLSGVMLVIIMFFLVRLTLPVHTFELARRRLQEQDGGTPAAMRQLKDAGVWQRIADRYFRTLNRIWKSVFFGFLTAGFIVALVPASVWTTLFLPPVSFRAVIENAALGVVVGMLSFIGSIGIVPFAAALAIGGVGFPGVVGCIVADLITIPVLNVWRRYFGTKATAYILAVFYVSMVGSTVFITYLFELFGWLPSAIQAGQLSAFHFRVDYTLILTTLFLVLTAALWVIKRHGNAMRRLGRKTSIHGSAS